MLCTSCGKRLPPATQLCPHCGQPVVASESAMEAAAPAVSIKPAVSAVPSDSLSLPLDHAVPVGRVFLIFAVGFTMILSFVANPLADLVSVRLAGGNIIFALILAYLGWKVTWGILAWARRHNDVLAFVFAAVLAFFWTPVLWVTLRVLLWFALLIGLLPVTAMAAPGQLCQTGWPTAQVIGTKHCLLVFAQWPAGARPEEVVSHLQGRLDTSVAVNRRVVA
jgi:hypothetical protein